MNVTFSKAAAPKTGALAIPVFERGMKSKGFAALDKASGGHLTRAAKAGDFTGKQGQKLVITSPGKLPNSHVILLGAGKAGNLSLLKAEDIGGRTIATVYRGPVKAVTFMLEGFEQDGMETAELHAHIAYGARLRAYSFDKYRTTAKKEDLPSLSKIAINSPEASAVRAAYEELEAVAEGVFLTRDLVSEPANFLYPESFAQTCRDLESLGLKVSILGEKEMEKLGMGSLLGVGQGSRRESKIAVMEWRGGKKGDKPVAFVGKGVTFDTGGISLKPGQGMWDMKFDMGGAGAVTGAMAALAKRGAKANVVGLIGLVENMPDGNAQRPGDVVTSMSGQTIEVLNTDAEGRLVLADVMTYAQEKYSPKVMIDLATLTGAIIISLAHEFGGMFSNDEDLCAALDQAAKEVGEDLWRMPLTKAHDKMINSDIADMKNISNGRAGGSSTAAAFLKRFVKEGVEWAHLDIAGVAWADKAKPTVPKGGSGYGVRLLDNYIRRFHEQEK